MPDFTKVVVLTTIVLAALVMHGAGIGIQTAFAQTIPKKEDWYPVWEMVGDLTAHAPTIAEEAGVWWVFPTGQVDCR